MTELFFQAICRTGSFMICAQTLLHFCPKASYEKYLKLLVGVMVLLQLFLPLCSFLPGGLENVAGRLEQLRTELQEDMDKAQTEAYAAEELLEKMTLEELRRRMETEAEPRQQYGGETETDRGTEEEMPAAGEMLLNAAPVERVEIPDIRISEEGGTADGSVD